MCGKVIPEGERRRTYCSTKCRTRYYNQKAVSTPEKRLKNNEYQREAWRKKHNKGKETIKCNICGKRYRQLGSHVVLTHKITAREYRRLYGMDVKKGMIPDDLRDLYRKQVVANNTIENLKAGAHCRFVKGDKRAGNYERSEESLVRLRKNAERLRSNKPL